MPATDPIKLVDRALADNRLAHALLIHGQNLSKVEEFAYNIAGRLLELYIGDTIEAQLLKHPDVFTLRPSKKSRIISADDTRELIRNIQHSPQKGSRKVAIIFEVDRLNNSAANAFLKTLEEPPLNTTILLLTTRPHSLLATIRSRCQLFRIPSQFNSFEDERGQGWLAAYKRWLADLLQGRPGGKATVPHYIIGAYGLIEQFSQIIAEITKETWKSMAGNLPEDMGDDERIALESRISISIRQDFLAAIEAETERFTRENLQGRPEVADKFIDAVHTLEDSTKLLRLNLKTEAMLESFLLKSLRIWTAKA
ncbi:MAG: DNA polymerase III subunit gamma/tau [Verrucomicrobiota bacterium]